MMWVLARNAGRNHLNVALIYIGLIDLVIGRLRGLYFDLGVGRFLPLRPGTKRLAESRFHFRRVEVADDTQDNVVRVNMFAMPVDQILTRDSGDGRILRRSRVRTVCTISKFGGFPARDLRRIVIAPRDAVV